MNIHTPPINALATALGGWDLDNNKLLKRMHNILFMTNATPVETAKI